MLKLAYDFVNLVTNRAWINFDVVVNFCKFAEKFFGDLAVGWYDDLTSLGIDDIQRDFFIKEDV